MIAMKSGQARDGVHTGVTVSWIRPLNVPAHQRCPGPVGISVTCTCWPARTPPIARDALELQRLPDRPVAVSSYRRSVDPELPLEAGALKLTRKCVAGEPVEGLTV